MMERISIQELAIVLTVRNGLKKKEAELFATTIFEVVKDHLTAERLVKIKGLGTFKVIDIEPRESVNVNTGERVLIEGHEKITFTPDTAMKELVNRPFSQFETVILNDGVEFDDDEEVVDVEDDSEISNGDFADEPAMLPIVEEEEVEIPIIEEEFDEAPVVEEKAPVMEEEEYVPMQDFLEDESEEDEPAGVEPEELEIEPENEETGVETTSEEILEPIDEETAEATDEEVNEEVTEATDEEVAETEPEEAQEETYDEEEIELEEEPSNMKKYLWVGLALVVCVLSFVAGYQMGMRNANPDMELADSVKVSVKTPADTIDTISTTKAKVDSVKEKPKAEPTATVVSDGLADDYQKYEQMDARVRTGAYHIVGLEKEVKAKEGETVRIIAKRILGPEMECYVEVYNGIKADAPLTAGQTIKIPKLQIKKKKTQQTINQE